MARYIMFIMFLILAAHAAALEFSEIMYNPSGDDDGKEFIEISGTDNLTGAVIGDASSNDTLELVMYVPGNLSLIVEDNFNHSGLNCSIYTAGSTIGNNLNNGGDSLFLSIANMTLQQNYSDIANEGYSIEWNGTWIPSARPGGTPCESMNFSTSYINETIPANGTENTTIPDKSGNCSIALLLYTDKEVYTNKEKITITNSLSNMTDSFAIEYWVEDLSGEIVKKKVITTNLNPKSYTPSIKEKEKALFVVNRLVNLSCNTNQSVINRKLIAVTNPGYEPERCPVCKEQECECPSCPRQECTSAQGSVDSFYTLAKKIGDSINLYGYVDGDGEYGITLARQIHSAEENLEGKKRFNFTVPVEAGSNTFLLSIIKDNKTLGTRALTVIRDIEELHSEPETVPRQENQIPAVNISSPAGMTVYESRNLQVTKYLKYGLVMIFALGGIVWARSNGKRRPKDRTRMGKGKGSLRDGRKAKRAHRKYPEKLHRPPQEK